MTRSAFRQHAELRGLGQQSVLVQQPGAVRRDLDSRADLAELPGAFQHAHSQPLAGQRERGGQAADPSADDDHVPVSHSHGPSVAGIRARFPPERG
jgi:hypothetical protein